ncbi:MAG: hypothetical protein D3917_10110 [Candidatus Electrothrix sp. AX5]|nr:hypothetical protein [Candidatus Electrothrix sp. AX5]
MYRKRFNLFCSTCQEINKRDVETIQQGMLVFFFCAKEISLGRTSFLMFNKPCSFLKPSHSSKHLFAISHNSSIDNQQLLVGREQPSVGNQEPSVGSKQPFVGSK